MEMMINGPLIKTTYHGPTTHRASRITASHKRDSETTWRKTIYWDHQESAQENARLAALALIRSSPMADWEVQLMASGYDHDHYWFIASTPPITPA